MDSVERQIKVIGQDGISAAVRFLVADFEARNQILTVIQVGACNGKIDNDHLHDVIKKERHVEAHLIEAVDWLFDQLVEVMRPYAGNVICHHAALGAHDEVRPFFSVSPQYGIDFPESPEWKRYQIGSLTDEHLKLHVPETYITSSTMEVWSPRSWMKHVGINPEDLNLLMVDAEGFDEEIVSAFLEVARPEMIVYEHHVMPTERKESLFELLRECGYVSKVIGDDVLAYRPPVGSAGR